MIDMKETIEQLEERCVMLGNPEYMEDAIKVLKMWRCLVERSNNVTVYVEGCPASKQSLLKMCKDIEGEFFPSTATRDFIVTIQGSCLRRDNAVQTIECVHGVKEVKPREKDC